MEELVQNSSSQDPADAKAPGRAATSREEIDLSKSKISPVFYDQVLRTEQIVTKVLGLLSEAANSCPESMRPKIRMDQASLQILEYRKFLKDLSREARKDLVEKVCKILLETPHSTTFMTSHMPILLHSCNNEEVAKLCTSILSEETHQKQASLLRAVLTSRQTLKDLREVVDDVGYENLVKVQNKHVRNILGWAVIGSEIRALRLPKSPSSRITHAEIEKRLTQIKAKLERIIEITKQRPELAQTDVAQRYRKIAHEELQRLKNKLSSFQKIERLTRGSSARRQKELFVKRRVDLATVMLETLKIEVPFAINFTMEKNKRGGNVRKWKPEELKLISTSLKALPEWVIIFTPYLKEIRRVAGKKDEYNGLRDRDGQIWIPDIGVDDRAFAREFDRKLPTKPLMFHEIGHSFQIAGNRKVDFPIDPDTDKIACTGEYLIDFDAFLELSHWRAFERTRFSIEHHQQAVRLDQELYPLERPCWYKDRLSIFRYQKDEGRLYCHRACATFNLRQYGTTDPFEDFADAFAEYFELPERLAYFSPEKFLFFDLYFHLDERRKYLYEKIDSYIEKKRHREMMPSSAPC